jgi:hypothetical protein
MKTLLKCKCGAEPFDAEWSGVVEYDGCAYQSCMVQCQSCDADVSINVNTDLNYHTIGDFEKLVSELWNNINLEQGK